MSRFCITFFIAVAISNLIPTDARAGQEPGSSKLLGFAPASRSGQARAEALALSVPNPEKARAWLRSLTEEPHVAGTPADRKTAIDVRDKLRAWGWEAELVQYDVLLNYPASDPVLKLVSPTKLALKVREDPWAADKDSASHAAFAAFHGYGSSGQVTAQVVYANYGRPEDFSALERLGVEVKGKIVLLRYGELFRGLKVREAQKRGATGVLIYSDPADDGYARGDIYPNGPYRPPSALQRGSVQFLSLGPGDPSTPSGPSVTGAKRLAIDPMFGLTRGPVEEAGALTQEETKKQARQDLEDLERQTGHKRIDYFATIPSLPISYEAARPILESLGGANVPSGWQGALPFAYHIGPGPAEVALGVWMDYQVRPIWNVIATLKGSAEPDRWVFLSNHRDAWVYGAVDPGSGTASTLETCRALGEAVKNGWKPRRTIVYASWDAEEYGLVGSTEWVEDHMKEIDAKAMLMLNVDAAVSGVDMHLDGIPSLRDMVVEAAEAVTDVRTGKTLAADWLAKRRAAWGATGPLDLDEQVWTNGTPGSLATAARSSRPFSPQMNALGSGSDYTAFLDHAGVPAIDIGFSGRYGVYHSIYDDFFWMEKFGDPEFITHAMAARLYAVIMMRAAAADVLPMRFVPYGEALREQVDDLRRVVERKARAVDPKAGKPALAFEGLPSLIQAVRGFEDQARLLDRATEALTQRDGIEPTRLAEVNDALARVERAFLMPNGLPGRPWFKHAIYAPGLTTGYACWTLPGVRQAILQNDAGMLAAQVPALVERLQAATAAMRKATGVAQRAQGL